VSQSVSTAGHNPAKLRLDPSLPLADGLGKAMQEMLAHGGGWAGRAGRQPIVAVHELRKSIRRARALLALTRDFIPHQKAAALAHALQSVQAAASAPRDIDVLLATLRTHPGLRRRRAVARLVVDLRRQRQLTRSGLPRMLARTARTLPSLGRRYARALPERVSRRDLEKALRDSHRRVRHLHRRARRHSDDERFHDWRKAVKTLSYQLELVASTGRGWARKASRRVGDLAQEQGEVTDLMMLHRELATRPAVAGEPDAARVMADLQALIDDGRQMVLRQGKRTLAQSSRRFIRSLA
jgi:CHAD domain-containing protein